MTYNILDELFEEISQATNLKDVAYHQIIDGKLNPIHKTSTDTLGIDRWKNGHYANPVYIKDTFVLQEIVRTKEYVAISDTKNDERSSEAFFFFGVDSNLIIPVIKNDEIKGIVCTVSINEIHNFTQEEIDKCVKLVNDYKDKL